jgi:hypothetical protein
VDAVDSLLAFAGILATLASLAAAIRFGLRPACPERRSETLPLLLLCAGVFATTLVASVVVRSGADPPPPAPVPSAAPGVAPRPPATTSPTAAPAPGPSGRARPCEIAATCERLADALAESARRPPGAPAPAGWSREPSAAPWDATASWIPYVVAGALLLAVLLMTGPADKWIVWTKRAAAVIGVLTATAVLAKNGFEAFGAYRGIARAPARIVSLVPVPEQRPAHPSAIALNVSWPIVVAGDGGSLAFVVPFAEGGCRGKESVSEWPGARPRAAFRTFLADLGAALAECAKSGPVRVTVRGFASSSEFAHPEACDPRVGDLNVALANERARGVAAALERCSDSCPGLSVTTREWKSSGEMRQAARFHDRLLRDAYSPERGTLNRRAEIVIDEAGGCAVAVDDVEVETRPAT